MANQQSGALQPARSPRDDAISVTQQLDASTNANTAAPEMHQNLSVDDDTAAAGPTSLRWFCPYRHAVDSPAFLGASTPRDITVPQTDNDLHALSQLNFN